MSLVTPSEEKLVALRARHAVNLRPQTVTDPAFMSGDPFLLARDAVQVKYEMLCHVHHDHQSVSHAAGTFGFSHPSFYQAQAQAVFAQEGLPGLLSRHPRPKRAHKLTEPVVTMRRQELRIRDLAIQGEAILTNLNQLPVAVEVPIRKPTEYRSIIDTGCLEVGEAGSRIQRARLGVENGAVGPGTLASTYAALDPALRCCGGRGRALLANRREGPRRSRLRRLSLCTVGADPPLAPGALLPAYSVNRDAARVSPARFVACRGSVMTTPCRLTVNTPSLVLLPSGSTRQEGACQ